MKLVLALLMLLAVAPALAIEGAVEATTAINLPVDSITIYPDGLMAAKRMGSLEVPQGQHDFVVKVPESAEKSTLLLTVTNSTVEKVVYEANPIYTLNVSSPGSQAFVLSYLMYNAGYWQPRYDLHLTEDSVTLKANAIVRNQGEEDLKNVLLKLVAGLPTVVSYPAAKSRAAPQMAYDASALLEAAAPAPAPAAPTGETKGSGDEEGDRPAPLRAYGSAGEALCMGRFCRGGGAGHGGDQGQQHHEEPLALGRCHALPQ
jgi:hypothetical protein